MSKRRVTAAQLRHVRAWKKSGLTARQYAHQEDISHWSLYAWASWIKRNAVTDAAPTFLPVAVIEAPASSEPIDLVLGNGRVIRVSSGFDSDTLTQVISVAEGGA